MIEVSIDIDEYPDGWDLSPAMWECYVVGKLKDAGIPVDGALKFRGIKKGRLTMFNDPKDFAVCTYRWEE